MVMVGNISLLYHWFVFGNGIIIFVGLVFCFSQFVIGGLLYGDTKDGTWVLIACNACAPWSFQEATLCGAELLIHLIYRGYMDWKQLSKGLFSALHLENSQAC